MRMHLTAAANYLGTSCQSLLHLLASSIFEMLAIATCHYKCQDIGVFLSLIDVGSAALPT